MLHSLLNLVESDPVVLEMTKFYEFFEKFTMTPPPPPPTDNCRSFGELKSEINGGLAFLFVLFDVH